MKTMRKISRVTCVFALFMVFSGVQAQTPPWAAAMAPAAWSSSTTVDTVVNGAVMPLFVMPDPVLNDGFTTQYDSNQTKAAQGLVSSWTWWIGASKAGGTSITKEGKASEGDGPYVEITWATKAGYGADTVFVREDAGTCTGDTSIHRVVVIPIPSFAVRNNPATVSVNVCDGATPNITLDGITDNGVVGGNMKIRMHYRIDSVTSAIVSKGNIKTTVDTIVTIGQTAGADVVLFASYPMVAVNGQITRYRFAFDTQAGWGGTTAGGINDHISRKSDFLALVDKTGATDNQYTFYAPTSTQSNVITYIVYPKPNTGSIYYIPNNFNK